MLGAPGPAEVDPKGKFYAFEKGVEKTGGGRGTADVGEGAVGKVLKYALVLLAAVAEHGLIVWFYLGYVRFLVGANGLEVVGVGEAFLVGAGTVFVPNAPAVAVLGLLAYRTPSGVGAVLQGSAVALLA